MHLFLVLNSGYSVVWAYSGNANGDATTGDGETVTQCVECPREKHWSHLKVEESSPAQACFSEVQENPQGTLQFSDH